MKVILLKDVKNVGKKMKSRKSATDTDATF